jgi:hypothetical protein
MISRNRGGTYILAELDGSMFDRPVAAFRIIPYFAHSKLDLDINQYFTSTPHADGRIKSGGP